MLGLVRTKSIRTSRSRLDLHQSPPPIPPPTSRGLIYADSYFTLSSTSSLTIACSAQQELSMNRRVFANRHGLEVLAFSSGF